MLNIIWLSMIFLSVLVGLLQGRLDAVIKAVTDSATLGFQIALSLAGIMAFWLGIMNIAQKSGLIKLLAKFVTPLFQKLFPEVPPDSLAMGSMVMNITANLLGLGNAATPFGLIAMKELQKINHHAQEASNAMCTFLAINTSCVQLIPATAMAILAANGGKHTSDIIISTLFATSISMIVAVFSVKKLEKLKRYKKTTPVFSQEEIPS